MSKRKRTKKKNFKDKTQKQPLVGKTDKQERYIEALREKELVVCTGPAGTGKTFVATTFACDLYLAHKVNKLIFTRPNVPAGKSLGFFPGSLEDKLAPWVAPFTDILNKRLGKGALECGIKNGNIEFIPFETMRGKTFDNAVIILDEAQNSTEEEMKMFLTRLGKNSLTIIDGDITQNDLQRTKSGLNMLTKILEDYTFDTTEVISFTFDDIVRSGLCKRFVRAFEGDLKKTNVRAHEELRETYFLTNS